ncbi:tectonin beta-propeller repeat-containing protein [Palaemon carinicauda]|uniref:tectonin beta-propeller repeat-containing protein n=1 Tax=Palaemon carinicauda TaxID=392227 RepID=UPI0035B5BBC1
MPSSQVFAVNNRGRVFSLSTDQAVWRELPYLGVEFKRVSAHETVIWALGGDHQVYVYVYGSSVPIRVCEEAYENQRWNPVEGFSSVLLPTDRAPFSSADGLTPRPLTKISLPTLAWSWESPWHLHDTHEGQALDKEAWTYAIDFPRSYSADRKWNSCVRRRKWVRYRRYVALDTWSAVPSIHQDHTQEPFIDICVGGGEVPGDDADKLMVWGVTALGRVMVRGGVDGTCPEGCNWVHIPTPADKDVTSVWVGRSGRVWAVTWDGHALIRTGVTRDTPTGTNWVVLEHPEGSYLHQLAVGVKSVWALTRDHRLWFRRGLEASFDSSSGKSQNSDLGTSWLLMVGLLNMVAVGPNDQVWGIGKDDHSILLRTGVSEAELTGRTWKSICLPLGTLDSPDPSRSPTPDPLSVNVNNQVFNFPTVKVSPSSEANNSPTPSVNSNLQHDSGDLFSMQAAFDKIKLEEKEESLNGKDENNASLDNQQLEDSRSLVDDSAPSIVPEEEVDAKNITASSQFLESNDSSATQEEKTLDTFNEELSDVNGDEEGKGCVSESEPSRIEEEDEGKLSDMIDRQSGSKDWSEARLRHVSGSSAGSEASVVKGNLVILREDAPNYDLLAMQAEHLWMWVTGGGCWIRANNMPKWFLSEGSPAVVSEPWRINILQKLKSRQEVEVKPFSGYEEAVEGTSWVISGKCRWWAGSQWVPASLELTMVGSRRSQVQDATLVVQYTLGSNKMEEFSCCTIMMAMLCIDPAATRSVVAIYHPNKPLQPKTLLFSGETEAEDWLNHISSACNQFRGLLDRPSPYCVWGVTAQGGVFVHDCSVTEEELRAESVAAHKQLSVGTGATPLTLLLDRGFRPGFFITVSGKIHDKADQFHINLQSSRTTDANIALHLNPRFAIKKAVLNSKKKGIWGSEEKEPLLNLTPGNYCEISIVCDDKDFKISVNDKFWCSFKHRLHTTEISHICVRGSISIDSITYNHGAGERQLCEWYWRGLGGHLLRVEGGAGGVTWGISHDYHVFTYTGATGGGLYKGNSNEAQVRIMSDVRHMYVWENQRWNPVTGFTYRGFPTDRYTWSDQTGRLHKTRESTKLPSRHWQWISEWCVDYHTPGGVDREGWQYATDFPRDYHAHKYVTDLVRRRRWVRKCRISTSGPWQLMEKVALIHISVSPECAADNTVPVWGVSASGEIVFRSGVTASRPWGEKWNLIPAECPMRTICASVDCRGVWAVSKDGRAHLRIGVSKKNPRGLQWVSVDAPNQPLVEVATGAGAVWGLDQSGALHRRKNVLPLFPEGTEWAFASNNVASISVAANGAVWAVLDSFDSENGTVQGVIARLETSDTSFVGTGWEHTLGTGWSHVSARVPLPL